MNEEQQRVLVEYVKRFTTNDQRAITNVRKCIEALATEETLNPNNPLVQHDLQSLRSAADKMLQLERAEDRVLGKIIKNLQPRDISDLQRHIIELEQREVQAVDRLVKAVEHLNLDQAADVEQEIEADIAELIRLVNEARKA